MQSLIQWIRCLTKCTFCIVLTLSASFLCAQTLVKDINADNTDTFSATENPQFTVFNGCVYFTADDGVHGKELWKTDGTAAGTVMVKDIESKHGNGSNPYNLVVFKSTLYFFVKDAQSREYLWKSNGTESGTQLVKFLETDGNKIRYSSGSSKTFAKKETYRSGYRDRASDRVYRDRASDRVYRDRASDRPVATLESVFVFVANGNELWKSDGTQAGSVMITEFDSIERLTAAGKFVYFSADDGKSGKELWRTNGTEEDTFCVKDIVEGEMSGDPRSLTVLGNILYFAANDSTDENYSNYELWRCDIQGLKATKIKEINPGSRAIKSETGQIVGSGYADPGNADVDDLVVMNDTVYFVANDGSHGYELWRSNGTEETTIMVKDIYASDSSYPSYLTAVNGTLFFAAEEDTNGRELWKSDGTEQGTRLVKDIKSSTESSNPSWLTALGKIVCFSADDTDHGRELWKSDGTSSGTVMLKNIATGTTEQSGDPRYLFNGNSTLYFTADDGSLVDVRADTFKKGRELWKSKGVVEDAATVLDINKASTHAFDDPFSGDLFTNVGSTLYFVANDGNGKKLWKSTGTSAGTAQTDLTNTDFKILKGTSATLFFTTSANDLYKTNGTESGTVSLAKQATQLTSVSGYLYFLNQSDSGKMYATDGSTTNTKIVRPSTDTVDGYITELSETTLVSGKLYFMGKKDGETAPKLWKLTSTYTATPVKTASTVNPAQPQIHDASSLKAAGSKLYFIASNVQSLSNAQDIDSKRTGFSIYMADNRIWTTDASGNGIIVSEACVPYAILDAAGSYVYFSVENVSIYELWQTDGTSSGTARVTDVSGNLFSLNTDGKAGQTAGSNFYFRVKDENGTLWQTNGKASGTKAVKDSGNSLFAGVTLYQSIGSIAYFGCNDGSHGFELWQTDATTTNTKIVKDMNSLGSTQFYGVWTVSGILYFVADDGISGRELWRK